MIDPAGHVQRTRWGGRIAEAIVLEKVDEDGKPLKCLTAHLPRKPCEAKKQSTHMTEIAASSDEDDHDYEEPPPLEFGMTSGSGSDSDDVLPSNTEVFISIFCLVNFVLTCRPISL
jgi:hypothetical protein